MWYIIYLFQNCGILKFHLLFREWKLFSCAAVDKVSPIWWVWQPNRSTGNYICTWIVSNFYQQSSPPPSCVFLLLCSSALTTSPNIIAFHVLSIVQFCLQLLPRISCYIHPAALRSLVLSASKENTLNTKRGNLLISNCVHLMKETHSGLLIKFGGAFEVIIFWCYYIFSKQTFN